MTGTPMIEMRGVEKAFGSKQVLRGVDLHVARGTSMVIIGGSGTGKSVTLKCVLGLVAPDTGAIRIDGKDVTRPPRDLGPNTGPKLLLKTRVWGNI